MPARFRSEIEDQYVAGLSCAICTAHALRVHHLQDYADYISCEECGSSFVIEAEGERVLYGRVSDRYPDTKKVVLRNWAAPAVVARLASGERERSAMARSDVIYRVTPPSDDLREAVTSTAPADGLSERGAAQAPEVELPPSTPAEPPHDLVALHVPQVEALPAPPSEVPPGSEVPQFGQPATPPADAAEAPPELRISDVTLPVVPPLPGAEGELHAEGAQAVGERRYRVRVDKDRVVFPMATCAHCSSSPAKDRIIIHGSLPMGNNPAIWRRANFRLPLCAECHQWVAAYSAARRNARLQAHLVSMVVTLAFVVAAMGLGVVDLTRNVSVGLLLVGALAVVGYLLTLVLLLGKARNVRPTLQAYSIGTTLTVQESGGEIAESFFDFRNASYAGAFLKANPDSAKGTVEDLEIQAEASKPDA